MTSKHHQLIRDFFTVIPTGELPDTLTTEDMTAWTTLQGDMDKTAYLQCIKALDVLFSPPIRFTIKSLTAEEDRVAAEVESQARLVNGEDYNNTYVFVFRIKDEKIAAVAEHYNAVTVQKKLIPLMNKGRSPTH